jgi:hypothetical protein
VRRSADASIRQRGAGPRRGLVEEDPWPTRRSTS